MTNTPVGSVKHASLGMGRKYAYKNHNVTLNLATEYMWGTGRGRSQELVENHVKYPSIESNTVLRNYNAFVGVAIDF